MFLVLVNYNSPDQNHALLNHKVTFINKFNKVHFDFMLTLTSVRCPKLFSYTHVIRNLCLFSCIVISYINTLCTSHDFYDVLCSQVSHPHLLMLMAVNMSAGLNSTRLVYERVNVGSLYSLLHQKVIIEHFRKHKFIHDRSGFVLTVFFVYFHTLQRDEFPLLQLVDLLSVVLQVCEVLMYLNGRSLVLRALSSHTVLIVHPGVAKVTGLGFMVPRYTVIAKSTY